MLLFSIFEQRVTRPEISRVIIPRGQTLPGTKAPFQSKLLKKRFKLNLWSLIEN